MVLNDILKYKKLQPLEYIGAGAEEKIHHQGIGFTVFKKTVLAASLIRVTFSCGSSFYGWA